MSGEWTGPDERMADAMHEAAIPPTCRKEREMGARAYTLACIRKAGHDGLHRDPLSNVEWATNDDT